MSMETDKDTAADTNITNGNDLSTPPTTLSYGISKCTRKRCVTCSGRLCMDNSFKNWVTGEVFTIDFLGSCNTKNCVYVIKCKQPECNLQYVGHTINHISSRISQHKSSILRGGGCKILREHFTKVHSIDDLSIIPIHILPQISTLKERENIEEDWILKLNVVYPYGLNVRVKKVSLMDAETTVMNSKSCIYQYFNVVKINRGDRGGNSNPCNSDTKKLFTSYFNVDSINIRDIRTSLCNLKKKALKDIYLQSITYLHDGLDSPTKVRICLLLKDLSWFYLLRIKKSVKPKIHSNFMVVNYANKYVEYVNFNQIFMSKDILAISPFPNNSLLQPTISYKYPNSIRSKILNYKDVYDSNLDPSTLSCDCSSSRFVDQTHNHIITGDLDIIDNVSLKNLVMKGLNYRDQVPPSIPKTLVSIKDALNIYISKLSEKVHKPVVMFEEWKLAVMSKVTQCLENRKPFKFNSVLTNNDVIRELNKLHTNYVLVPTDKASNNVTIVCKKFYLELLNREINSNTFQRIYKTPDSIIADHEQFLLKHNIKIAEENKKLPTLYITPKQHKTPIGFRYITAGSSCSLQQLSTKLGFCLKSMLKSAKNKSAYDNRFYNRNDYFIIDGHDEVINFLNINNNVKCHKSISTFDFSTLYTSIPQHQLKENLKKFVDRIFDFKNKTYIIPNEYKKTAYFSDSDNSKKGFSKETFLECLYYLIDNAYIDFNGQVYRQIIGIPMGTNAGPHMANIYLYIYEFDYIQELIRINDENKLLQLQNIFRFQDDLLALNDNGLLSDILSEIYPKEMIVTNTNISPRKCNYLDLTVSIFKGKFRFSLFDKRKDFSFNVISYPFLEGNIPKAPSYGIYISQLLRFCTVNSEIKGFLNDTIDLTTKLKQQGFDTAALRKKFLYFYHNYINVWGKFGVDIVAHIDSIF